MLHRNVIWSAVVLGSLSLSACNRAKTEVQGGTSNTELAPLKSKGPPSRFVSKENSHHFDTMDQEQTATHVFEIRNEGEGELLLRIMDSTCGCTVVRLGDLVWDKKEDPNRPKRVITVEPADSVELELTWNTEQRSGEFKTVTTIETSDTKQSTAQFAVEGQIIPYVQLTQSQLHFDDARNNEVTTGYLYLYSKKLDNLEITEVKSSNPLITAEFEPADESFLTGMEAKCALKANIKIEPGLPIGQFSAVLTFKTNCEERPELSVTIGGQVGGDVTITPFDRISFGTIKTTESATRGVFLKFRGESDSPVEIKEPKIVLRRVDLLQIRDTDSQAETAGGIEEPNFFKVTLEKIETGKNRFQLKVEVPKGAPGGQFRGVIELQTDHPTAKLVKIPVSVQVTK